MRWSPQTENKGGLIGDCERAKHHLAYSVRFDSQQEAQALADRICDRFGWGRYKIVFSGEVTTCVRGRNLRSRGQRVVILHRIGETVGSLLHELAHEKGQGHDIEFKEAQEQLLGFWESDHAAIGLQSRDDGPWEGVQPEQIKVESEELFDFVIEELQDSARPGNGAVTMVHIGTVLLREGINTTPMLRKVEGELKRLGIRVVRDY